MRHPHKYKTAVNLTYLVTSFLEISLAVTGYIMFGEGAKDEITSNIVTTNGYPRWLSIVVVVAIAIIPITKVPLNVRPIISTVEMMCGLGWHTSTDDAAIAATSHLRDVLVRVCIRTGVVVIIIVIAILVPSFDRIMSLMGSFACFSICMVLPCVFGMKLFSKDMSRKELVLNWFLIVVGSVCGLSGTVCAVLPQHLLGIS